MNEIQLRTIVAERNPDFPAPRWKIFNAPRPLYGHCTWQGEFISGIFYAAIHIYQHDATRLIELNCRDAAVELVYITEQEAFDAQIAYYRNNPRMSERIDEYLENPNARNILVEAYLHRVNK